MIDLHADDSAINNYVTRYMEYLPYSMRGLTQEELDSLELKYRYWDRTLELNVSEDVSRDKAIGALVGLAVGDAVGTTLEFQPRDVNHVQDMVGGGPFRLRPGEWTDDTSMALCLAQTYLQANRLDADLFCQLMLRWYKFGENSSNGRCFDIGNATRYALEQYSLHGLKWDAKAANNSAGNGPIIRIAPVSIFRRQSHRAIYFDSKAQCHATHFACDALDASQFMALMLHYLISGYNKETAFAPHIYPLLSRVAIINAGEYKEKSRDQIRSSGYVIDTLEAAMWAVWHTDNFRDAILLAANLADDADSVAATAGQLAGALYGWSGIPQEWKEKLVQHDRIASMAAALFDQAPDEDTSTE
ncbi:ADP-ribosylglycohydrolase [Grimontella sp. AG753]|nr:ADP-ribosylglycohydrolase [Grimontella sp. AG753]